MSLKENTHESNYDKFKKDALVRFLTYEQEPLIRRLHLDSDETWIYIPFGGSEYRLHRQEPLMERRKPFFTEGSDPTAAAETGSESSDQLAASGNKTAGTFTDWAEADSNAVLTILDLLCHTEKELKLSSGSFTTLAGLNRVQAGNASNLGESFFKNREDFFDQHAAELKAACERLGAVPAGKGDVAYRIPLFGPIALQISFYESDDEFPAQLTFFMDQDICDFLFYETLWYMISLVMDTLEEMIRDLL